MKFIKKIDKMKYVAKELVANSEDNIIALYVNCEYILRSTWESDRTVQTIILHYVRIGLPKAIIKCYFSIQR